MPLTPKVVIISKPGYRQAGHSRGLCFILLAVDQVVRGRSVTGAPKRIRHTAGSNDHTSGGHAMPRCDAADFGSKEFTAGNHASAALAKRVFLKRVMFALDDGPVLRIWETGTKMVTANYFGWLEAEDERREHFHIQVRVGHTIR